MTPSVEGKDYGPLDDLVPALLVCRDFLVSKTSRVWSKLDFLPTGLGVVILWFTFCLAISVSAAGKPKEDSEPTPCGSPILVMTLILGLLAQLHPSASGTLGTVVDSIPEIASTGCVLSAGIAMFVFFSFGLGKISTEQPRAKRVARYQRTTMRRDFWRTWRRCKYWCCASVANERPPPTLPGKEVPSSNWSTQLAHFLWVSPVARTKTFDCVGGRRIHWRGLTQRYFGLMGSVALGTCFLAKQMIMHSVVTFPVLMFVCIQSFVAADRHVRGTHVDRTEDPQAVHGFICVLVNVVCGMVWMPLANSIQGMYMVQENVQGSLMPTSVSVGLSICGFVMRYSNLAAYTRDTTWDQTGRFILALGWTSFAFGTLSFRDLSFYAVFLCCNWLCLEEDAPRIINNFLFSLLAKNVTGLHAQQVRMADKTVEEAAAAGYSQEELSKAGMLAFAHGPASPLTGSTGPAGNSLNAPAKAGPANQQSPAKAGPANQPTTASLTPNEANGK